MGGGTENRHKERGKQETKGRIDRTRGKEKSERMLKEEYKNKK